MSLKFPKHEKLKSRKVIEQLFSEGKSVVKYPLKAFFLPIDDSVYHQAAFAVPKRIFKLAVTRNRVKRQIREAYRLQKSEFQSINGKKFAVLFLYIGKDKPQYDTLVSSMQVLLKKLTK